MATGGPPGYQPGGGGFGGRPGDGGGGREGGGWQRRGGRGGGRGGDDGGDVSIGELHGRVPPNDIQAEKAVLSCLLLDNDAIHSVTTELRTEDFYHPAHQILYDAMIRLKDRGEPVDLTTLAAHLQSQDLVPSVGGLVTIAEIADYEATPANVVHYARIIREKAVKRSLISVASEVVALGFDPVQSADQLLDEAESRIFSLSTEQAKSSMTSLSSGMHDAMDHIEMLMTRGGELTGCPTGYEELDRQTGGLQPGDLIILAARPSMGKTAFALNLARNAAIDARQERRDLLARDDDALAGAAPALQRSAASTSRPSTRGYVPVHAHKPARPKRRTALSQGEHLHRRHRRCCPPCSRCAPSVGGCTRSCRGAVVATRTRAASTW